MVLCGMMEVSKRTVSLQLVKFFVIVFAWTALGSTVYSESPSQETSSVIPPIGRTPVPINHRKSMTSSPASQPSRSVVDTPFGLSPLTSAAVPSTTKGYVPSLPLLSPTVSPPLASDALPPISKETLPSMPVYSPTVSPPLTSAAVPSTTKGYVPSLPLHSPTVLPPLTSDALPPITKGTLPTMPVYSPTVSPPLTSAALPPATIKPLPSLPLHSPMGSPPYNTASPPLTVPVHIPSLPPSTPESKTPLNEAPAAVPVALAPVAPSRNIPQNAPSILPSTPGTLPSIAHQRSTSNHKAPLPEPITPVGLPPMDVGQIPAAVHPARPRNTPPISPGVPPTSRHAEISPAISPVEPGESPPTIPVRGVPTTSRFPKNSPAISPVLPVESPPTVPVQSAPPASRYPEHSPTISPVVPGESPTIPDLDVSPALTPPSSIEWKRNGMPVAAPPNETPVPISPVNHSPTKGSFSAEPPSMHNATRHFISAPPSTSSPKSSSNDGYHSPASSPSASIHKDHHPRYEVTTPAPASYLVSPPPKQQDQVIPPAVPPKGKPRHYPTPPFPPEVSPTNGPGHYAPPPFPPAVPPKGRPELYAPPPFLPAVSPTGGPRHYAPPPFPPVVSPTGGPRHYAPPPFPPVVSPTGGPRRYAPPPINPGTSVTRSHFPLPPPALSPAPESVSGSTTTPFDLYPPKLSPSGSLSKSPEMPPPPPILALPPPPPNEDCSGTICTEPLTNTPPGSPCACVWPMQVGLRLSVDLYTFFPLVSELAAEIAAGVFMKQSQVRIMGANAASQEPENTIVLIDLVPLGERFDNTTAFLTFQRFWSKKVDLKESYFGDYEVLYVRYQGLPPSPPLAPSTIGIIDDGPYSGNDNNGRTIKPLGVDVRKKRHTNGLSGSIIAIIVLSAFVVLFLCSAAAWFLLIKHRAHASQQRPTPRTSLPSLDKPSGSAGSMIGSVPSSVSLSFGSSIAPYMGSAKTYSITDIERATNNFDDSRILGEGGFGRVYSGVLDDGTKAAVKVLKRDDQQGGREFLAEVEMLSRLHHRNLVKLIGICTEERARCLVYELIPNGSVESHLHGVDKESAPLDWVARMKIALGAARGLAYLHEDSSPRVIHRDFKSSNILLEHDFTPKVSDFGLARAALDEESRHISTRVMGTFGYVAPEYAMTGHLLVKSDVYSYGVVLLELLTGRKPVDMSQPPGQENLVAWARPLLTSKEGLEIMIDSSLGSDVPFDSVAKVAAIASMCVQPEVSHRPFMGEVVQALKLVCNECDGAKEIGSRTSSHENLSIDMDERIGTASEQLPDPMRSYQYSAPNYDSGFDTERGLSVSEMFSTSVGVGGQASSGSFRRCTSSGPLRTGRGWQFWQRMRRLSGGSVSEHGVMFGLRPGSH